MSSETESIRRALRIYDIWSSIQATYKKFILLPLIKTPAEPFATLR